MKPARFKGQYRLAAILAASLLAFLSGCGTPGSPRPPSLDLPDRVTDLSAARTGSQVSLTWTMPKRNTDKLPLKTNVDARVCRHEGASNGAGECVTVGQIQMAPGADASFAETLPSPLAAGNPRALSYFVELQNRNGRSAGPSHATRGLRGEAHAPGSSFPAAFR